MVFSSEEGTGCGCYTDVGTRAGDVLSLPPSVWATGTAGKASRNPPLPPRCLPRHEVSIGTACCVFAASGPRSQCLGVTLQIRSGGRWPSRGDAPHIATYQQTLFPAQTLPSKWARAVRSILVLDFEWDHCIFLLDYSYSTEGFFIFAS